MDESYEYSDKEVDDELTLNETESKTTMMMMVREAVTAQLMYQHNCSSKVILIMTMMTIMEMATMVMTMGLPAYSHQSYSHQVGICHNGEGWEYDTVMFPPCTCKSIIYVYIDPQINATIISLRP